ncbi:MAG: hypothetical protein QM778_21040 [Myxococcales bacterium]
MTPPSLRGRMLGSLLPLMLGTSLAEGCTRDESKRPASDAGARDAAAPRHCSDLHWDGGLEDPAQTFCSDGLRCNGAERCSPNDLHADERGCAPGTPFDCGPGTCSEGEPACLAPPQMWGSCNEPFGCPPPTYPDALCDSKQRDACGGPLGGCGRLPNGSFTCTCPQGWEATGTASCHCPTGQRFYPDTYPQCTTVGWSAARPIVEHVAITAGPAVDMIHADQSGTPVAIVWGTSAGLHGRLFRLLDEWDSATTANFALPEGEQLTALDVSVVGTPSVATETKWPHSVGVLTATSDGNPERAYRFELSPGSFEKLVRVDEQLPNWGGSQGARADETGMGLISWSSLDTQTNESSIWVQSFRDALGWSPPTRLAGGNVLPSLGQNLAVFADQYATFRSDDGSWSELKPDHNIRLPVVFGLGQLVLGGVDMLSQYVTYGADAGWSAPEATGANASAVNMLGNGGGYSTLWVEGSTIRVRRFVQDSWQVPETVLEEAGSVSQLRVAAYGKVGSEIVVWCLDGTVVKAAIPSNGGWDVTTLRTTGGPEVQQLDIQLDPVNRAFVVWVERESDTSQSIYSARYQ